MTPERKAYLREWRQKNRGRLAEHRRAWIARNGDRYRELRLNWAQNNPKQVKEIREKSRLKNIEKILAYGRSAYHKKREYYKEKNQRWYKLNAARATAKVIARKAAMLKATPKWADINAIRNIYEMAQKLSNANGVKHHVDHIVPLKSPLVCGLHCEQNLRVITATENCCKKNTRWPNMA